MAWATWAHAVNSSTELDSALDKSEVNMLEVDLCWNVPLGEPVTRHAQFSERERDDELLFTDLLQRILDHNKTSEHKKGLKLDFKNGTCVPPCVRALLATEDRLPSVWLNADIVTGPVGAGAPFVDAAKFLNDCKPGLTLPNSVLSPGWTTTFRPFGAYTENHVSAMRSLLDDTSLVATDVVLTFPVRGSFVRPGWPALSQLLDPQWRTHQPSLTIWTAGEGMAPGDVDWIRHESQGLGADIYFDIDKGMDRQVYNPVRVGMTAMSAIHSLFSTVR